MGIRALSAAEIYMHNNRMLISPIGDDYYIIWIYIPAGHIDNRVHDTYDEYYGPVVKSLI